MLNPSAQLKVENKNATVGDREVSALYIDSQHMPSEPGRIRSHMCSVCRLWSLELKNGRLSVLKWTIDAIALERKLFREIP